MIALTCLLFLLGVVRGATPIFFAANGTMPIPKRTDDEYVYLSTLTISAPGSPPTTNMLWDEVPGTECDGLSGTSILINGSLYCSWIKASDPRQHVFIGPASLPFIEETWDVKTDGNSFEWTIKRIYLQDFMVTGERTALIWRTLSPSAVKELKYNYEYDNFANQCPSFVDITMFMNETSAGGFPYFADNNPNGIAWFEFLSTRLNQQIHLSPSNLAFNISVSSCDQFGKCNDGVFFEFGKPPADGTSGVVSIGLQGVDPRNGPAQRSFGQESIIKIKLDFVRNGEVKPTQTLDLTLKFANQSTLSQQIQDFVSIQNMFMGWIFGNNPASIPALQEMWWFPTIQGLYSFASPSLEAIKKQIGFFAKSGIKPDGNLFPRWYSMGFYNVVWGPFQDQVPHFIMSIHASAMSHGDKNWVQSLMPQIDKVAGYLVRSMNFDYINGGVFQCPGSGLADGGRHASNWYDIVEFGNFDAYVNIYAIGALQALVELKTFTGNTSGAQIFEAYHARAIKQHNAFFWNEKLGFYRDWIDVDGFKRNYFFTDHNLLAIIFGVADQTQSKKIIENIIEYSQNLCDAYGIPRSQMWGLPCNLNPIVNMFDIVDDRQDYYVGYENGGAFFHTIGLQVLAYSMAGYQSLAYDTFNSFLVNGFSYNHGWAQQLYWDTNSLVGSDPLNNCLLSLWGFLRGGFGVTPTLTKGLKNTNIPFPEFEGAVYRFAYLGKDVCLRVQGGRTVLC